MEYKSNSGHIIEVKEAGSNTGIVAGYIATWDLDRGDDKFMPGAFSKSLNRYKQNGRAIRLKAQHKDLIGGFPIAGVYEDDRGLYGVGEINLDVQKGKEFYSLAKQGVITDFSIGYEAQLIAFEGKTRSILESEVWEGSLVEEPMNPFANVTDVKAVNGRSGFPKVFAEQSYQWDSIAAEGRVRTWADANEGPNEKYTSAFLWHDSENAEVFTSYKLQVVDIVDETAKIVPRAVFAVRAVLSGARGGVDIPEADIMKIKDTVNTLYSEMDLEKPFEKGVVKNFCLTELKNLSIGTLRHVIQNCFVSKDASSLIAELLTSSFISERVELGEAQQSFGIRETVQLQNILKDLKKISR